MGSGGEGLFKRAVRRLSAGDDELEAEELSREAAQKGATMVSQCAHRQRATVVGTVRSLTLRPQANTPTLEVELYDGTGSVTLIWLGRRELAGISPGRQLRATGCLTKDEGRKVIFNPRYELIVAAPTSG